MDLGELLTVTVQSLESFATDFLEYEYLLGLGVIVYDGGGNLGTLHIGSTDLYFALIVYEEHFVELDGLSVLGGKAIYEDVHSSFYFKLLACNVNDCEHL